MLPTARDDAAADVATMIVRSLLLDYQYSTEQKDYRKRRGV